MSMFEPVIIEYQGEELTIPSDKVMQLIGIIEGKISAGEITSENPSSSKLAAAYAAAINFAGGKTTQEEIYLTFFTGGKAVTEQTILGLILMMTPPQHLWDNSINTKSDVKKKKG